MLMIVISLFRNQVQGGLLPQESSLELQAWCIIVIMTTETLRPSCQGRCLTAAIVVLPPISIPPIFLVDHPTASSHQMVLSARVFICPHHTQLLQITSHMCKSHESSHGGIFHPLLIPTDSHHVAQKMETSTGIETDISLVKGIILGSTGGRAYHLYLVSKLFSGYFLLDMVAFFLFSSLVNKQCINVSQVHIIMMVREWVMHQCHILDLTVRQLFPTVGGIIHPVL